jgi:hypothetical protein
VTSTQQDPLKATDFVSGLVGFDLAGKWFSLII